MAESLRYQRMVNHRNEETRGGQSRSDRILRRFLAGFISLLILVLLGELTFHLILAPRMELRRVQLDSDIDISLEKVKDIGGIHTGELFTRINESDIAAKLTALPDVKKATVRRIFPDSLGVSIVGRKPLSILMVDSGGSVFPALVDDDGVVFKVGHEITDWDLPIVRGVEFGEFHPGMSVDRSYGKMFDDIKRLMRTSPELLKAFSEFRIEETYPGVYEWILIPVHLPVKIRASVGLTREQGMYILKVLEVLRQRGLDDISEIDFRTGDVVYSNEGGNDGL